MPYKSEIHIAIDRNPPALSLQDGTPANPYRGPANSAGTSPDGRAWFDYVMTYKVAPNDSVRIGPGVYLTRGFIPSLPPWMPESECMFPPPRTWMWSSTSLIT